MLCFELWTQKKKIKVFFHTVSPDPLYQICYLLILNDSAVAKI